MSVMLLFVWFACALLGYCLGTQRVVSHYDKRVGDSMAKVLVIDDEPEARVLLDIHLRHRGYDVLLAGDGWTGLQLFHQEHPDVILLDLNMPELDGVSLSSNQPTVIRNESPGQRQGCLQNSLPRSSARSLLNSRGRNSRDCTSILRTARQFGRAGAGARPACSARQPCSSWKGLRPRGGKRRPLVPRRHRARTIPLDTSGRCSREPR